MLNHPPEVVCHHEIFNPRGIFLALHMREAASELGTLEARDADPLAFLERIWTLSDGADCVGFKMTRGQDASLMQCLVDEPAVRKIVLTRRNRLKTFVSELLAQATDRWEVYAPRESAHPLPRLEIHADQLRAHAAANRAFYDDIETRLAAARQDYLRLSYEDLFRPGEQARLLAFLGLPAGRLALEPSSVKQTPADLREVIANFSELETELSGTEFHHELRDPEP